MVLVYSIGGCSRIASKVNINSIDHGETYDIVMTTIGNTHLCYVLRMEHFKLTPYIGIANKIDGLGDKIMQPIKVGRHNFDLDWASWQLNKSWLGNVDRQNNFRSSVFCA